MILCSVLYVSVSLSGQNRVYWQSPRPGTVGPVQYSLLPPVCCAELSRASGPPGVPAKRLYKNASLEFRLLAKKKKKKGRNPKSPSHRRTHAHTHSLGSGLQVWRDAYIKAKIKQGGQPKRKATFIKIKPGSYYAFRPTKSPGAFFSFISFLLF